MRVRKRKNNSNFLILILVILLLGISVGYASFADTLNIVGTANANGKFSVDFVSAKIKDSRGINVNESKAIISHNKDVLAINIKDMQYPGSGATISCVIKNTGTVPAKLTGVTFSGNDDSDISVIFSDSLKIGQTLDVNESWTLEFVVKWNVESKLSKQKAINFSAQLNYEQDIQEYQDV